MASARLERTTVELTDGTGRAVLRASGQVVLFPGFMALYDEGRDDPQDEEGARMPPLREGEAPAKTGVEATQHFTQPPPRYSEASLVKRMEELGIGRPSTYASILQTLKDREYVRVDKGRFVPEESGRLVIAFLERFFERYVSYDYTAELEEELGGVSTGRSCSTTSGATSSRRPAKSWTRSRARSPRRSTSSWRLGSTRHARTVATRGFARTVEPAG
jgi:DNA topoisomerase-1